MEQEKCLFNEDYLNLFHDNEKELLKKLAQKSFLSDDEFEDYEEILKFACNAENEKIREYMFKGFWKIGKYTSAKWEVPKIVCLTRYGWDDLDGEKWRNNKKLEIDTSDNNEKKKENFSKLNIEDIMVSNYGRIGIVKENEKNDRYILIYSQYEGEEKDYKGQRYFAEGYLCVDIPKNNFVYQLVANFWLNKPEKFNPEDYAIHHINNNGYENTPANLIYLTNEQHNKVHNKG